ncbi:MAG: FHA domain-containing protein [Thermoleophilaceae bacterium]|nr:FHA domain-containing protein [Thermoleophilaceae bacterium]
MSFFKQLETRLERLFENGFKSAFKSEVEPVELAHKLAKEMDDGRTVSVSRTYAPNEFVIFLSPADRAHFASYEEGLKQELSAHLLEHARKRDYSLISRPQIEIETHDELELGQFGIQARLADVPASEPQPAQQARPGGGQTMIYQAPARITPDNAAPEAARAALIVGEKRYALLGAATVVGRGSGSDIRVDDANVSRNHIELRAIDGQWTVRDLGSTNGSSLAGQPLAGTVALQSGDELEIGNTTMTFELE